MSSAPSAKSFKAEFIDLHFRDDDGTVRVIPSDQDLMILSVNEAINACRAFTEATRFKVQFDTLLNTIGKWLTTNQSSVAQAFLTTRDAGLLLLVVMKGEKYDSALEKEITELDIRIANDPDCQLIDLSVLAIPNCPKDSLQSFLSRKMQLRYVIDGDGK